MAKQRRDSIDQYKAGGRDDLAGGVLFFFLLCHVQIMFESAVESAVLHVTSHLATANAAVKAKLHQQQLPITRKQARI
jgi:hypothetical protein